MDRQQIALKLVLDSMGLKVSVDSFESRLILQKAIYLAQAAGVNLGYYYQWYLYGPYCPSLTKDEYAVAGELAQGNDDSQGWTLDGTSKDRVATIGPLFKGKDKSELSRRLELLASVHFLVSRKQIPCSRIDEIVQTLHKHGKSFDEQKVRDAMEELKKHDLLAS